MSLRFSGTDDGFVLRLGSHVVLRHAFDCPSVVIARGAPQIDMLRGNFRIDDSPSGALAPAEWRPDGSDMLLLDGGSML